MTNRTLHRLPRYGPYLALLATAAHLGWEAAHGGVQSHHLLARKDLPEVSNWWGLLILPLLGWLASRTVSRRAQVSDSAVADAVTAFAGSLLVGVALSASFAAGIESASSGIFFAALAAGLFLPTYRAEYVFGFVLGMTFVFGSVLPMIAASLASAIAAVARFLVRPAIAFLLRKARARRR